MPVKSEMKAESKENQKSNEPAADRKKKNARAKKSAADDENFSSELGEPRWSVISFESRVAEGLSYDEAAKKLEELRAKKISGLCIVTDEAGARANDKNTNREKK